MYKTAMKSKIAVLPNYTATFPQQLQRLVNDDCQTPRRELQAQEAKVAAWIDDIGATGGQAI